MVLSILHCLTNCKTKKYSKKYEANPGILKCPEKKLFDLFVDFREIGTDRKGGIHNTEATSKKYFRYYSTSVLVFEADSVFADSVVSDFTVSSFLVSHEGAFFPA